MILILFLSWSVSERQIIIGWFSALITCKAMCFNASDGVASYLGGINDVSKYNRKFLKMKNRFIDKTIAKQKKKSRFNFVNDLKKMQRRKIQDTVKNSF
jgi:hypothetical protein